MKENRTIRVKKEDLITHLAQCYGIKTVACRKAKVGRTQFYEWLKSDEKFAFRVREIEESFLDYAESKLVELIELSDRAAIMFYLKAKGKSRGYK